LAIILSRRHHEFLQFPDHDCGRGGVRCAAFHRALLIRIAVSCNSMAPVNEFAALPKKEVEFGFLRLGGLGRVPLSRQIDGLREEHQDSGH